MARKMSPEKRAMFVLAADGAVITAATFALLTGIALLLAQAVGDREVPVGLQVASGLAVLLGGVAGPALAWFMHGRRITLPAILGALLAGPVVGAAFFLFLALSQVLGWIISPISDAEGAGPLVLAALVALDFVYVMAWLLVDGARDLRADPPTHKKLDIARILAVVVLVAYSAIVVVLALGEAGPEMLEAIAFMLMGAVSGAATIAMADVGTRVFRPRAGEPAPEPVAQA